MCTGNAFDEFDSSPMGTPTYHPAVLRSYRLLSLQSLHLRVHPHGLVHTYSRVMTCPSLSRVFHIQLRVCIDDMICTWATHRQEKQRKTHTQSGGGGGGDITKKHKLSNGRNSVQLVAAGSDVQQ